MAKHIPDFQDADLLIKVYDLRREEVMRASRMKVIREFLPRSMDDMRAILSAFDHPLNAALRQVGSYWEMVYGMAKHGIVSAEYWMENNGEGMNLFAKVHPFLAEVRAEFAPTAFQHAEWIATNTEAGRRVFAVMAARVAKAKEAK
jgi:hypothetical protein